MLRVACGLLLALAASVAAAGETALDGTLGALLSDVHLSRADVGIHVVAVASGRVIYTRGAMRRFIAASNEKIVTAAAALDTLGADYRFETALYGRGRLRGGVLDGDLILRGGGDPTLGGRYDDEDALDVFRRWARNLRAKGLSGITGDVVADDTFFDRVYRHPNWTKYPAWNWYYAPTSALSVNDNCVVVTVRPGAGAGAPASAAFAPASAPVKLLNLCETSTKRHAVWFDRAPGENTIKTGGHVRLGSAGYSSEVTVPDPPLYAATTLKQAFEAEGVRIGGRARVLPARDPALYEGAERLCLRSTALPAVLQTMVKRSHNHYAEQVMKTIGAKAAGVGSWKAGTARAAEMLKRIGFSDDEFRLDDGSGLSRQNELTPALLTAVLVEMTRSPYGPAFAQLLPVAGEDGTLAGRLTEAPCRGNVRAKTGYLNGVGALSGYATTRSGVPIAFSILINDSRNPPGTYSMRQKLDAICSAILDGA